MPAARTVLRRALLVWGLGHLAIGDRRGWLLLALELLGVVALAFLAAGLLEGTRSDFVFLALAAFFAIWGAQAIDAHREAIARGAEPGGAIGLLALAPVVVVVMTGFWLVAGSAGSPTAALQRYATAWRSGRADVAGPLFLPPRDPAAVAAQWATDGAYVRSRLQALAGARHRTIDPNEPFASFVFEPAAAVPGGVGTGGDAENVTSATFEVQVVERRPVRGDFFGFPTASQRTELVERLGRITLRSVVLPPPFGIGPGDAVWRVASLAIGPP